MPTDSGFSRRHPVRAPVAHFAAFPLSPSVTFTRTAEFDGHIINSGIMQRAMGIVMDLGSDFDIEQFSAGWQKDEPSYCRMSVSADDRETLQGILHELHQIGADLMDSVSARAEASLADRVVPVGFYSIINYPADVRY